MPTESRTTGTSESARRLEARGLLGGDASSSNASARGRSWSAAYPRRVRLPARRRHQGSPECVFRWHARQLRDAVASVPRLFVQAVGEFFRNRIGVLPETKRQPIVPAGRARTRRAAACPPARRSGDHDACRAPSSLLDRRRQSNRTAIDPVAAIGLERSSAPEWDIEVSGLSEEAGSDPFTYTCCDFTSEGSEVRPLHLHLLRLHQ